MQPDLDVLIDRILQLAEDTLPKDNARREFFAKVDRLRTPRFAVPVRNGLVNGAELRRHQSQHAWCSWPGRSGFCVPHGLHSDILGKSGMSDGEARDWYRSVMAKWANTPIGDDVFRFWQNELAQKIGTVTSRPVEGKGHAAVSAARQTLLRRHPELGVILGGGE